MKTTTAGPNVYPVLLISYRILSVVFSILTVLSVLAAIIFAYNHFYGRFLAYASYAAINALLAAGFWNMKKWIVSLLGITLGLVLIMDIVRLINGVGNLKSIFVGLGIIGVLFIFSSLSRNSLQGEYKNYKVIGFFVGLLILAQIAITFLK